MWAPMSTNGNNDRALMYACNRLGLVGLTCLSLYGDWVNLRQVDAQERDRERERDEERATQIVRDCPA